MKHDNNKSQKIETVYLVDGHSYIHRAYHAIRNLSNSKGFPTNIIFGFTKMLLKLLADKKPKYIVIAFDVKGPTFRHRIYEDYKANRPPMPDDMSIQIPFTKEIIKNLNIKIIEKEGYEADDVIGTLARLCEDKGFKIIIVSSDKDFRQIISPNISMWDSMNDRITDYSSLKKTYGFEPEKFIDIMGLSGDVSDNIPGVPGIGEKTAVNLIKEFGSFDNLFEHAAEIKRNKLRENLQKSKEKAVLSRKLVRIDQFVPIDDKIDNFEIGEPDKEELSRIFNDMEFKELWEEYAPRQKVSKDYRLCLSKNSLKELTKEIRKKGIVSVDTETTSKDPLKAKLVGISFSLNEQQGFYLPIAHQYLGVPSQLGLNEAREILKDIMEDKYILKVGQNIKYDAEVLRRHGIELKGIHFDTMIASYVINPGLRRHNLDYLAQHYLNYRMISYHEVAGKGKNACNFSEIDVNKAMEYSCEDADIALRLMQILEQQMIFDKNERLFYDLEMKLLPVLMDMEMAGIKIDIPFFKQMSVRFSKQMKRIEQEIFDEAGMEFNINSHQQLGYVLFEKLKLPVQKKTARSKNYSTDVKVLKKLSAFSYKIPELVLRYRTISKLKSTYLDALIKMVDPDSERIHTSYNQTVAATGRLSSSNPNLQNIPVRGEEGRNIRKGFIAGEGHFLVSADYSQVELRIFAHYSQDEAFMDAFKKDKDIHTRTASEILGGENNTVTPEMRRIAKAINFGIIYGMGPKKLADELGIDLKTAKNYMASYHNRYPGVNRYRQEMIETAREKGFVSTLFNRRRYLPDIRHANRVIKAEAERMAINTPIQGTAADLIKMAMITIHNRLKKDGFRSRMLLQVHDELVFEVPEEELESIMPMIRREMEEVYPLDVPLKVDINMGKNWDEAH